MDMVASSVRSPILIGAKSQASNQIEFGIFGSFLLRVLILFVNEVGDSIVSHLAHFRHPQPPTPNNSLNPPNPSSVPGEFGI